MAARAFMWLQNGTMTGQRYIDEVLLPHVRLFRGAVGDKFVFMDDNATCHRTLTVQDCLDSEGIQRLVWPARSPDLNPIENVWNALGASCWSKLSSDKKNTLIRALTEEWINCLNSCWIMLCKVCSNRSSRIVTGGKVRAAKRLPRKSHTCSMGLRSGDHADQSIRSISSLSKSCSEATVR
ncbi:uncharacterized protein TNCV_333241 [Trichonephila clavipes]|nr:uncharacterized protein TNCV_333241 [Trichonephila clavipes]